MQKILAVLVFARKVNDRSIRATRVAGEEGALLLGKRNSRSSCAGGWVRLD